MKTVYIILTRTNTMLSRMISFAKGDKYTHAALALDDGLESMFSFGRRYCHNPILGCFKRESINEGLYRFHKRLPGAIIALEVSDEQYHGVRQMLSEFIRNSDLYEYNYTGLISSFFHSRARAVRNTGNGDNHKFLCSEFVYYVLFECGILDLHIPKSFVRPQDFLGVGGIIYEGDLKIYAQNGYGMYKPAFAGLLSV